jgi:hypothetical protein
MGANCFVACPDAAGNESKQNEASVAQVEHQRDPVYHQAYRSQDRQTKN